MFRVVSALILMVLTTAMVVSTPTSAHAATDWEQQGSDIPGTVASTDAGKSVALSDDASIVAVGSWEESTLGPGSVRVYEFRAGTWTQQGLTLVGGTAGDFFGHDLALSANGLTLAVGAPGTATNTGQVVVYSWDGTAWVSKGLTLAGSGTNVDFGFSVALSNDGNILAVGGPRDSVSRGKVFVYAWNGTAWVLRGTAIAGDANFETFGRALDLNSDGTVLVAGARNSAGGGTARGETRVYAWDGTSWNQRGTSILGEANGDLSGQSVAISANGTIIASGAHRNGGAGAHAGHLRVFGFDGTSWLQRGGDIDGVAAGDEFGYSVSLGADGLSVAAGSPQSFSSRGAVRVFSYGSSGWTQQGNTVTGRTTGELFGSSAALARSVLSFAAGSPGDDTVATNSGLTRVFSFPVQPSASTGAVSAGTPGIYLHVAGPVGRQAEGSPVYYGSDRVAKTSTFLLTISRVNSSAARVVLSSGVVDPGGDREATFFLPRLEPGSYDVVYEGKHRNGTGLRLTARIVVGNTGEFTELRANLPYIW